MRKVAATRAAPVSSVAPSQRRAEVRPATKNGRYSNVRPSERNAELPHGAGAPGPYTAATSAQDPTTARTHGRKANTGAAAQRHQMSAQRYQNPVFMCAPEVMNSWS